MASGDLGPARFVRRARPEERPPFGSIWNTGWRLKVAAFAGAILLYIVGLVLLFIGALIS